MITDLHIHSSYSADGHVTPEAMVKAARQTNVGVLCFTDHMDIDFPTTDGVFTFSPKDYLNELTLLKERYDEDMKILAGIEFGMQSHLRKDYDEIIHAYDWDYVLGAQHLVCGMDPYDGAVYRAYGDRFVVRQYFDELYASLQCFPDIDALAHVDYPFRYVCDHDKDLWMDYRDVLYEIFRFMIDHDIALEWNLSGCEKIQWMPTFYQDIMRMYYESGGRTVVIGSDAHEEKDIAKNHDQAICELRKIGFSSYAFYEKRCRKNVYIS